MTALISLLNEIEAKIINNSKQFIIKDYKVTSSIKCTPTSYTL